MNTLFHLASWGIAASLCLAPSLASQGSGCTPPNFAEVWVDPIHGNDTLAENQIGPNGSGDPNCPFETIYGALMSVGAPGIVHCLPGIYSDATNGEDLPIRMRDRVHVIGAGAKECVIRGDGSPSTTVGYPINLPPGGGLPNGVMDFRTRDVLVLFNTPNDTSIEGFTFQGGDVQIYTVADGNMAPRASNCVFDMRNSGSQGLLGPDFGVLLVSPWNAQLQGYSDLSARIFNNTFIQGWRLADGSAEVSKPDSVAICNVNNPMDISGDLDPDQTLRGIGEPSIQNNIIRQLWDNPRTSMLGVDLADVTVLNGTRTGPTNAFATGSATSENSAYVSQIIAEFPLQPLPPAPRIAIGNSGTSDDPGFVGEMIGGKQSTLQLADPNIRDWRLLPDSPLVDLGSSPNFANPCAGRLTATNNTSYVENPASPAISFDWDGEGYGNPRIGSAPSTLGTGAPEVDIGCDEADLLVVAGYANDTKGYATNSWAGGDLEDGNQEKIYIFPFAGQARPLRTKLAIPQPAPPCLLVPAWTIPPGTEAPPVQVPIGTLYLDRDILTAGLLVNPTPQSWTNTESGLVHDFAWTIATEPDLDEYYNLQVSYKPDGATARILTNLQSEIR